MHYKGFNMKIKIVILAVCFALLSVGCSPEPVSIESIHLLESLDEEMGTQQQTGNLPAEINNIYLSVKVNHITPEDEIKVVWTFLDTDNIIDEQISSVDQAGSGYVNFNIHIAEGFPSGNYTADVYLNGTHEQKLDFSVQ